MIRSAAMTNPGPGGRARYLDLPFWVGFSRLRPTAIRENVAWVKEGFRKSLPTHIARYNLETRTLEQRIDLEEHNLNAVFSIMQA